MASSKKSDEYADEELIKITEQWLKDKARIDADLTFGYYYDRDQEYGRYLYNSNLKALFRHAARLHKSLVEGEPMYLYRDEDKKIAEVYGGIRKNGYYKKSKLEEKRVRAWFGKIVSRQTYRRLKKS